MTKREKTDGKWKSMCSISRVHCLSKAVYTLGDNIFNGGSGKFQISTIKVKIR